jgi:hypothetical protein
VGFRIIRVIDNYDFGETYGHIYLINIDFSLCLYKRDFSVTAQEATLGASRTAHKQRPKPEATAARNHWAWAPAACLTHVAGQNPHAWAGMSSPPRSAANARRLGPNVHFATWLFAILKEKPTIPPHVC